MKKNDLISLSIIVDLAGFISRVILIGFSLKMAIFLYKMARGYNNLSTQNILITLISLLIITLVAVLYSTMLILSTSQKK